MKTVAIRRIVAAAAMLTLSSLAFAQTQAVQANNGLGQAWPNVQDVSASPSWHVYVFQRDGIKYIQINDANGGVHAAFAFANDQFLALPLGKDSERLSLPTQTRKAGISRGEIVYRDSQVQVSAVTTSDGTGWNVSTTQAVMQMSECEPERNGCGGGRLNTQPSSAQ